ncbi:MAG: DUF2243 domain-containing protein [Fimbriimonadaceae bacterium]|nr:DUF2243 domain-containing protein [Fimbriimonadaceae bacterium]QYK54989.1 MAG: DUF2243 domain-containing protein [Fimbriimonadaceae bacterium]
MSGWGLFNLVEGIVDHHILRLHHVLEYADRDAQTFADLAFLTAGGVLLLVGWSLQRSGKTGWLAVADAPAGAGTPL